MGWVAKYAGKNVIKGYSKWFGVDLLTAVRELRMLGIEIAPAREAQIAASMAARSEAKRRRREALAQREQDESSPYSNGTFAYIAGYTSGGLPYGVTWEEMEEDLEWDEGRLSRPVSAGYSISEVYGRCPY